ncbi:MAG: enoyl-CoA hydratase-related protein, partial [Hyphomicrobiales bacterium]
LQRLPKLIAPGIAHELAFTGRRFSAGEAHGWGLCNAVFGDRTSLMEGAFAMARDIAAKSPLAIAGIKQASNYARDHSVADGLDQIATWNGGMLRPDDLMAALKAKKAQKQALFADLLAGADQ